MKLLASVACGVLLLLSAPVLADDDSSAGNETSTNSTVHNTTTTTTGKPLLGANALPTTCVVRISLSLSLFRFLSVCLFSL